jgi:hypothetical protein
MNQAGGANSEQRVQWRRPAVGGPGYATFAVAALRLTPLRPAPLRLRA